LFFKNCIAVLIGLITLKKGAKKKGKKSICEGTSSYRKAQQTLLPTEMARIVGLPGKAL
jgi:hypothetical protein